MFWAGQKIESRHRSRRFLVLTKKPRPLRRGCTASSSNGINCGFWALFVENGDGTVVHGRVSMGGEIVVMSGEVRRDQSLDI